ncbi:hypothetical protein B0H17DRAFT_1087306 [Mycena rosella]|uniref:F-box domain-containing protein n=1 Tax=Mycena rosella TaxID=1033263 RepID=A0AAD7CXG4_MYCRO|nr:hypothetical protein B0H17DRAFT_1087306 [Mycena rosella]
MPKLTKKIKQRLNPLFANPLSSLSRDISARFPSELHDYIIDHLYNDRHTLSACTLVCSTWHASATYHLFQNAAAIHVHRMNFLRFCELLASQRLNGYIGRLNLESHIVDDRFDGEDAFQFNVDLQRFTGLQNVKYLRLDYHHELLLPAFFTALAQNFSSVTELELSSFHFDSFTQLLQIHDTLPMLRRLALVALIDVVVNRVNMIHVMRWLPSHPCIRRLAIGQLYGGHIALVSTVLRTLGPGLEHLIVYDADITQLPDLSQTTGLRTLQITGILCYRDADLAWLPALLSQLNSRVLERIVLVVELPSRADLDLLDWPRLAALEGVQRVEFSLSGHNKWATKVIEERLRTRRYALRVGSWKQRYQYGLGAFDL